MTTTTLTLYPTDDNFMDSNVPTTNKGNDASLDIGEPNTAAAVRRALIKFNLAVLPANATIVSATLSLYCTTDASTNARTFRVYRQKKAWVETQSTWNIYSTGNNWTTAGGFDAADCEQTDIGNRAFSATETLNEYKDFPLTTGSIQEVVAGSFTDRGYLVKADTETDDMYRFGSRTGGSFPKLVIVYTVPAKAELNSQSSGNTGAAATNSLTIAHTVNAGSDRLLIVGASYGSGTADKTATGVTWDGNAMTRLDTIGNTSNVRTDLWYYIAPAVKTANVVISFDANIYGGAVCASFNNVNQSSGFMAAVKHNANDDSAFLNGPVAINNDLNLVVDVMGKVSSAGTLGVSNGQVIIATNKSTNATAGNNRQVGMSYRGGLGASVYMGWDWATGIYYASDVAAPLNYIGGRQFQALMMG